MAEQIVKEERINSLLFLDWESAKKGILIIGLLLVILYSILILTGSLGFGIVRVKGDSMSPLIPWGDHVLVLPLKPSKGDIVCAWINKIPGATDEKDKKPSLVIKQLVGNKLEATNAPDVYKKFRVKGVVVAVIPVHKIMFWENESTFKPTYQGPTEKELRQARIEGMQRCLKLKREMWWMDGNKITEGISIPNRINVNEQQDKLFDRKIGSSPYDTSHAAVWKKSMRIEIDISNLNGQLVFKPVNNIQLIDNWQADIDSESIPLSKKGSFYTLRINNNTKLVLSCQILLRKKNSGPAAIKGCGIEEIVFLPTSQTE